MALRFNKAFAVVPCCVFANLFPERVVNGNKVREYSEFLEYLMAKDPTIRAETLPLEGRNRVLFRIP